MAIEYKRLTEKELNIFINMRINQLTAIRVVSQTALIFFEKFLKNLNLFSNPSCLT